jgi:hypothetical protein
MFMDISLSHPGHNPALGFDGESLTSGSHHIWSPDCAPMTIPAGFHAYRVPSMGSTAHAVCRNCTRMDRSATRPHVLLLDGNADVLAILGQLLDDEGYDVTLSTGPLNDHHIRRLNPRVIFKEASFIQNPEGVIPDLPVNRHGQRIPVIYSTVVPNVARRLSDEGVPVLLKPFDLDDFLELLSHVSS